MDLDTSVLDRENNFSQEENDRLASSTYQEAESNEEEESLVEPQELLSSDRNLKKSKWLHLASTLIVGSLFALLGWIAFSMFAGVMTLGTRQQEQVAQQQLSDSERGDKETIESLQKQLEQKNVELAYNPKDTSEWKEIEKPEPKPQQSQPAKPQPTAQPRPQPQSTASTPSVAAQPQSSPQQETNPLDEWARLAALGTANGMNDSSEAVANAEVEPIEDFASKEEFYKESIPPEAVPVEQPQPAPSNLGIEKGKTAQIATIAIGESEAKSSKSHLNADRKFSLQDPEIVNLLSNTLQNNSYLEQKKREFQEADRLKELASTGTATSSSQATLIANTDNSLVTERKQIPLGNSVRGELANDIVWSEGIDSFQARGIIYLKEPLIASDGLVAIKANSSLIVEVQSVNSSGLVQLNAVAVSYDNSEGELVQEALPTGSILIQGEKGALIADRADDVGSSTLGQDILLGALGAGERAFDLINEPEVSGGYGGGYQDFDSFEDPYSRNYDFDRYGSGGYRYGGYSTRANEDSSLITGAAEGAFSTTKRRLEERSRQIQQENQSQVPIYLIESGTDVSIFINSFLSIES